MSTRKRKAVAILSHLDVVGCVSASESDDSDTDDDTEAIAILMLQRRYDVFSFSG